MAGKGSTELSFEERKEIERLLKEGRATGYIAFILERSHSCIKQELRRSGGREFYDAICANNLSIERNKEKKEKLKKPFSLEQMDIINQGVAQGWSQNKIRALAGVSHWKIAKYFKDNQIKYVPKNYTSFEQRIESLEQQIEIILDEIGRLRVRNQENK